jgi:hypothetical protein
MGKRGQGYGSEEHLHRAREAGELSEVVARQIGLPAAKIDWLRNPELVKGTGEREFEGLEFLPADQDAVREAWREFWPTTGKQQTWDAVGIAGGTWLLVEAKANFPEFCGSPTTAKADGRKKIERALHKVKRELGVHRFYAWTGSYYQYANRLAMLWFLRQHGVEARLVFVYFFADRFPDDTPCPQTEEEWNPMFQARRLTLGLPQRHELSPYESHVFVRVASTGE